MLKKAASDADVAPAALKAAFPGGMKDVLRAWSRAHDEAMLRAFAERLADAGLPPLKIREKVAFAVLARLAAMGPHKEAARRAAAYLALPINAPLGAALAWDTADAIWRAMGDPSTDFAWYTKRATLTGVWTSTCARWLGDDSDDEAETRRFLDARIANVMQIEKAKAQVRKLGIDPAAPIEFLGRLRYPAGR
ncbi:MAG: COQ9 family protein [Pseudomonadota bacterium]